MKRRKDPEQAARDVLDGRARLAAGELLELIHEINPTGRGLATAVERRRYELKSRLQSLLVRELGDDLAVTETAGVVAIRHKYLGRDACHARLDELDVDARSRLRMLLDTAGGDDDVASTPARDPAAFDHGALARGRAALAEYDYDGARAAFAEAAETGDPIAVRALLELLVDHLVVDDEALAVELSAEASADGEVRALLGLAAARTGDRGGAMQWLRELELLRGADAWVVLARAALAAGDPVVVDDDLRALASCDPAHPELHALRADAARLRASLRAPAEAELQALAGDPAVVESAARALLVRFPDSSIAGKILARITADRRRAEAERLLGLARTAFAERDAGRAAELERLALAAGADTGELAVEIARLDADQRAASDAASIARACEQLAAPARASLDGYLALAPELRARVRDRLAMPMLDWLEVAAEHARRARAGAVADAVLGLAEAIGADDDHALALLDRHHELLAPVPRARELRAQARERITARRRVAAAATLELAEQALVDGALDRCEQLSAGIDPRDVDGEWLDRVHAELRARRAGERRVARADELLASGDLVEARRELELAGDPRVDEVRAEVRRIWRVRSEPTDRTLDADDPLGELLGRFPHHEGVRYLVTDTGELVLATTIGHHIHVAIVAIDRQRVIRRIYLYAPEDLGGLMTSCVDGDVLCLAVLSGRVLWIDRHSGEPLRWTTLALFVPGGDLNVENVLLLPGASHLWIEAGVKGTLALAQVIEIAPWRVRREIADSRHLQATMLNGVPCVVGAPFDGGLAVYSERGTVTDTPVALAGWHVSRVASDSTGRLVALGTRAAGDAIQLLRLAGTRIESRATLPDSCDERTHDLAVAGEVAYVHHYSAFDESHLVAMRLGDGAPTTVFAIRAPIDFAFLQDRRARVAALWDGADRVHAARLDEGEPTLSRGWLRGGIPTLTGYLSCQPLRGDGEVEPAFAVLEIASAAAKTGDWSAVFAALEPLAIDQVPTRLLAHHCHLLGLACLHAGGDRERACAIWERGRGAGSTGDPDDEFFRCPFDQLVDLVMPPADDWHASDSVVRRLRAAITLADARMEAGDARGALAAIRTRVVTRHREVQSSARLAAAWLAVEPRDDEERVTKAITLARYRATHHHDELAIADGWSPERLAAIAEQCAAWLVDF